MRSPTKALVATAYAAKRVAEAMRHDWEAQRQEHWQRDHVKVISCKVSTEEHAAIMRHCKAAHCTRYALLRLLVIQYLQAMDGDGP